MNKETTKLIPGDELHLTMLMAPYSLNLVTGQDRQHLLAFGRAAFDAGKEAGQATPCLHQLAEPAASPFMYAIADGYGNAFFEEQGCVSSEAKDLQPEVDSLNQNLDGEPAYAVVAVYTHPAAQQAAAHPDDAAVDALAALMKAKLAEKRAKGYGGWNDKTQCPQQRLSDMLRAHVDKGDPVDVANFCAMLSARGEGIAAAPQVAAAPNPPGAAPENIREGAPYDNPAFEQLARDMGVWGTPQAALCAQFWLAAERSPLDRQQIQSMIDQHVGLDSCDTSLHHLARAVERAHGIQEQRHGQ